MAQRCWWYANGFFTGHRRIHSRTTRIPSVSHVIQLSVAVLNRCCRRVVGAVDCVPWRRRRLPADNAGPRTPPENLEIPSQLGKDACVTGQESAWYSGCNSAKFATVVSQWEIQTAQRAYHSQQPAPGSERTDY